MPTVEVQGKPIPKGSLAGFHRGGRVVMVEQVKDKDGWRAKVKAAGQRLLDAGHGPYDCPLSVVVVFTLPRPKSVSPKKRAYPCTKPDLDKLLRMILDGLADSGLYPDDSRVVQVGGVKLYPDHEDALDVPGAVITIEEVLS